MTDPLLEQFLSERDVNCPACGYNLRQLKSDRCPECGDPLELSLRLVEQRQFSLIAGLVGLSAGFGLGFLLLIYAGIVIFIIERGGGLDEFIWVNLAVCIVHGLAVVLWVRYWHTIRRTNGNARALLVAVCWLLPLASIVLFAKVIQ